VGFSALCCICAASLTGCAGAESSTEQAQSGPKAVVQAPAKTRAGALATVQAAARATLAGPLGLEFRLDGSRALGSSPAPVMGSGEFDLQRGAGSETIDLGEVAHQEPGTEHVVFLPSQVYLQPKSSTSKVLPAGKSWVSATLVGSDSVDTNFPAFALQAEAVNPELMLSELAVGSIAAIALGQRLLLETGHEGGQEGPQERFASAYEVTVDFARALGHLAGPSRAVLGQAIRTELAAGGGGSAGSARGTITVWLDAHGKVVQLHSTPPGAGVGTATMTLCCFGEAVQVAPPPTSQIVDISSLTPSGERENNGGGDSDGG
jgi:hypothetical protein